MHLTGYSEKTCCLNYQIGLERVKSPILVITGEKDYKIIKESADDIINAIPTSEGYTAPKLGHMWNLEDSKLFNRVLRRWINDKPIINQ